MSPRVSVLVVAALVVAACGGGDDDSSDGTGSTDAWCALAQQVEDQSVEVDGLLDAGGADFSEAMGEFGTLLDQAVAAAPDEIRDAMTTIADGTAKFSDLIGEGDDAALDEAAIAELEAVSDEMASATEQIEAYNLSECGISPSSGSGDSASSEQASTPDSADDEVVSTTAPATVDDGTGDDQTGDDQTGDDQTGDDQTGDDQTGDDQTGDDDGTQAVVFEGDADSDWCVAARDVEAASDRFEVVGFGDPEQVESTMGELLEQFEFAKQYAPPELAADLEVSFSAFQDVAAALRAADYDFINADLSGLQDLDGSIQAANERIEQYNVQVCGFDPAGLDAGDGGGFDPAAGTIREQVIAELVSQGFTTDEAECLFDKIDFDDPDLLADTEALIALFSECGIGIERLAELGG
jgi:hypothetical protein